MPEYILFILLKTQQSVKEVPHHRELTGAAAGCSEMDNTLNQGQDQESEKAVATPTNDHDPPVI